MNEPVEVWRLPEQEFRAGRRAFGWTVGPGGELVVLVVSDENLSEPHGWMRLDLPCDAELVTVTPEGEWRMPLRGVGVHPDHLALLPGGRTLVACAGAEEEPDGWERNAVVYGPDGTPKRELTLGHDIQALVTDRAGLIWLVYGDEGVYGGHFASQTGLHGMDAAGRTVWSPQRGELPAYPLEGLAAATEGRAVWLAWYPDTKGSFLTRIDPSGAAALSLPLPAREPVGFAVGGERAVFLLRSAGLTWCELVGGVWKERRRAGLRLPGELDRTRAYGRDGVLWFRMGNGWYRVAA
ncbi:hypothetical protein OG535_18760 [Kitasatospora sp. NBC_00085]|uniref:hypothetical protein n=1 Tax=unclassified Kitasatospora TaxID=2633591 RepID=UPI00324A08AD